MDNGFGELGFWIFLGMLLAAGTVSEAIKARDKERERQATLRMLLEKGDREGVAEVLAYLRERDVAEAVEAARARAVSADTKRRWAGRWKAIAIGVLAVAGGYFAGAALRFGPLRGSESALIPFATMLVIWVLGLTLAWRSWRSAQQKYDVHPDA